MRYSVLLIVAVVITCALPLRAESTDETQPANAGPDIQDRADRMLHAMAGYLSAQGEFSFHAEVAYDSILGTGQKVQYGGAADVTVRRPDRLRVEYRGDQRRSGVFFDGTLFTILDREKNLYSQTEVPSNIDDAVDLVFDEYGFTVPIADFVYSDPYGVLTEYVETGVWLGRHVVDGAPCHHLAFTQETIDWQIWIEDGPRPVPRKLVITYKQEPLAPQYSARLSQWSMPAQASDSWFTFQAPAGADKIEFLPIADAQPTEPEFQE